MPSDLQSVIKSVDKKTSKGGRNGTTQIDSFKLWLPSLNEVSGAHTYNWVSHDEGYQYPVFTGDESRIKRLSNGTGTASQWWLRSPHLSSNQSFCIILTTGDDGYYYGLAANSQEGVCFGFCVWLDAKASTITLTYSWFKYIAASRRVRIHRAIGSNNKLITVPVPFAASPVV